MDKLHHKLLETILRFKQFIPRSHIELFLKENNDLNLSQDDVLIMLNKMHTKNLIYYDNRNYASPNWFYAITQKGLKTLESGKINPYDDSTYINQLKTDIPKISGDVLIYTQESIKSFNNNCSLASSVMIGVASECAFNEMLYEYANWLKEGKEKTKFQKFCNNSRKLYIDKFINFRRSIVVRKYKLPRELCDNITLTFDAILDLLRIYRNESGHPTGKYISPESAHTNLILFFRYLVKLYSLKDFFSANKEI